MVLGKKAIAKENNEPKKKSKIPIEKEHSRPMNLIISVKT